MSPDALGHKIATLMRGVREARRSPANAVRGLRGHWRPSIPPSRDVLYFPIAAVQVLQLGLQLSQAVGLKVAAQAGKATVMLFHGSGIGMFGVHRTNQQPCPNVPTIFRLPR